MKTNIKFSYGNPPDAAFTPDVARELYDLLRWISRCASWTGPDDIKSYVVAEEIMHEARVLVQKLEGIR